MVYDIHIIGSEIRNGNYVTYGTAYSDKQEILWLYTSNNDEIRIYEGVAGDVFRQELLRFIRTENENLLNGIYKFNEDKTFSIAEISAEKDYLRKKRKKRSF